MRFKLVIIQSSSNSLKNTKGHFSAFGCEILATGSSGTDALELVRKLKPNVLVMDPFLPTLNCDEITDILERELDFPLVKLVVSEQKNDEIATRFFNNGGDMFIISPLDVSFCLKRMEKFLKMRTRQNQPATAETLVRNCAKKFLIQMHMPMTINGFYYLLDAVELAVQDRTLLRNIVSRLYPAVGQIHRTPSSNVERCIRTAVEQVFERGDINFLFPHFGHVIRPKTGKPANGDFIAILAQLVCNDLSLD